MDKHKLEEILNEEARKLVGYLMPILESMKATVEQKQLFKKIIYSYKNNITEMLINEARRKIYKKHGKALKALKERKRTLENDLFKI